LILINWPNGKIFHVNLVNWTLTLLGILSFPAFYKHALIFSSSFLDVHRKLIFEQFFAILSKSACAGQLLCRIVQKVVFRFPPSIIIIHSIKFCLIEYNIFSSVYFRTLFFRAILLNISVTFHIIRNTFQGLEWKNPENITIPIF